LKISSRIALLFKHFGVIHVMTAETASHRRMEMTTFTINDQNEIVAFCDLERGRRHYPDPLRQLNSQQQLAELAGRWPGPRLVEIWNTLPGVTPLQKFKDHKTAIRRIWARIQHLGESAEAEAQQPETPKVEQTNRGRGAAKGHGIQSTTPHDKANVGLTDCRGLGLITAKIAVPGKLTTQYCECIGQVSNRLGMEERTDVACRG
jgi:hypothetical protein